MLEAREKGTTLVGLALVFALFARGAEKSGTNIFSRHHSVQHFHELTILYEHKYKMADTMGSVITIDNFTSKMSPFDPNHASSHLYGLVDMGR